MKNKKIDVLREANACNHNPEKVVDPLFLEDAFFDANDIVQVKYEMLRRQRADKMPVQSIARSFGFSKVTFYEAQQAFEQEGVLGLQPKKRGPKQRHKLIPEIIEFAKKKIQQDSNLRTDDLLAQIQQQYGVSLHKRTLERGLSGKKKESVIKKLPRKR